MATAPGEVRSPAAQGVSRAAPPMIQVGCLGTTALRWGGVKGRSWAPGDLGDTCRVKVTGRHQIKGPEVRGGLGDAHLGVRAPPR